MLELGFWGLFGIFGSFASILSLFISATTKYSRLFHVGYAFFIVALVLGFTSYQKNVQIKLSELEKIKRIERQATSLSSPRDLSTHGNMVGYSLAVLAFFEKHQDKYPETYSRAKKLCDESNCTGKVESFSQFADMQNVSNAMRELVRGISTLDGR
ncbi:MAG: hypothetical protein KJ921_17780 [Proteobacteria bacterium]|nr:hypothetical protein [Pseudomonadota bacterium]